jgi:hypothetical protein
MKEYRLLAWPELSKEFQRTAHRRVLSDLSLRFMTRRSSWSAAA